ncbi:hypothetical protein EON81_17405 [bacterium]|nr:MAG: hypothetical protein EON81_17405 [bacterium]
MVDLQSLQPSAGPKGCVVETDGQVIFSPAIGRAITAEILDEDKAEISIGYAHRYQLDRMQLEWLANSFLGLAAQLEVANRG